MSSSRKTVSTLVLEVRVAGKTMVQVPRYRQDRCGNKPIRGRVLTQQAPSMTWGLRGVRRDASPIQKLPVDAQCTPGRNLGSHPSDRVCHAGLGGGRPQLPPPRTPRPNLPEVLPIRWCLQRLGRPLGGAHPPSRRITKSAIGVTMLPRWRARMSMEAERNQLRQAVPPYWLRGPIPEPRLVCLFFSAGSEAPPLPSS